MTDTHTTSLLVTRQHHLEVLQRQLATFGELYAPPHIITGIAQTQAEISQLRQQRTQQIPRPATLASAAPPAARGLVVLISPRRPTERLEDMASYQALLYHRQLTHCWLIATSGEGGSLATAHELARYFSGVQSAIWQVLDPIHADETFALVERIFTIDLPDAGLTASDVLADITGGTKPMTAGMVLACGHQRAMQYMVYQPAGPSLPVALRVQAGDNPA
ncbi:MAG TPA: hypothetical protein PLO33_14610 [Kouleothrix sp.]|nr:hypothetical protein [Kouleothrix sp.]HRC76907.1 hypothetical protein [Kouleothrix sp.]